MKKLFLIICFFSVGYTFAYEYNNLYYKEINELLIQVQEDNREENQLVFWEKYALELIKESELPIAIKAEELLLMNNEIVAEHQIETVINNANTVNDIVFVYNMGIVPNPAMTTTSVLVYIPSNTTSIVLKLYDSYQTQSVLQTYTLETGDNVVPINVTNLTSGLYTFVLEVNGVVQISKHLVVIH